MENDKKDAPNNTSEQETIKKLKADHDSLYGKYTQRAEKLYKVSEIAFKSNPGILSELPDEARDKITKENFGVETFEEAVAVLGEDFYKKEENKNKKLDNTDLDEVLAEFQKEKKISEYKLKVREEEFAIDTYISKNSNLFEGIENPKDLIKIELKKLSDGLSIEDKLVDASTLVKTKYSKGVSFANNGSGKSITITDKTTTKRHSGLAGIFGNKI